MADGQIKKILHDKGYGFLRAGDGAEYFMHRSGMAPGTQFDSLSEGDRVRFDIGVDSGKGPRASLVQLVARATLVGE